MKCHLFLNINHYFSVNNYKASPVISESDLIDFSIGVTNVFPLMFMQNSRSANNDLQFDFLLISLRI